MSFSGLRTWIVCPFKHKIEYIIGHREDIKSIHMDFGSSVHLALEEGLCRDNIDSKKIFEDEYYRLVNKNKSHSPESYPKNDDEWINQGKKILDQTEDYLEKQFPNFKVISKEEKLYEDIENSSLKFKGFIDLVMKHDDKIYIIDYKTTSWGWNKYKKSDKVLTLQLQLYKHFWALKHSLTNEEKKKIKLGFLLLKRTPKSNNIEFVKVSATDYKVNGALKILQSAIKNIKRQNFIRNRLSCNTHFGPCPYYKTKYCP